MQHKITCEIYAEFDKALNRDPFVELVKPYWNIDKHGQVSDFLKKWGRVEVCMRVWMASEGNRELCESLFRHLQYQEAMEFRAAITPKPDPYPVVIQQEKMNDLRQFMEELDGEKLVADTLSKKPEQILNTSGCPTILGCLNEYMTSRKWKSIREKTRSLLVDRDLFCGLEEVLRDGGHDYLCVGFGNAKKTRSMQTKGSLHHAKTLLNPETALSDQPDESLLRLA